MMKSRSIPMASKRRRSLVLAEQQLAELDAIAEERDYAVYSRIVRGISRNQERITQDVGLRYQNQQLLDRIHQTRLVEEHQSRLLHASSLKLKQAAFRMQQNSAIGSSTVGFSSDADEHDSNNDDCIFEFEL